MIKIKLYLLLNLLDEMFLLLTLTDSYIILFLDSTTFTVEFPCKK